MPIAIDEIVIAAIVDAIFGYLVDGSGAADWVRDKLRRDPAKSAYTNALRTALSQFNVQHPQARANLFDRSFFEHEAAPILAQFLIRDGRPDPYNLADRWAASLNVTDGERRTTYTREMEPIAAEFLELLNHALQAEPVLAEINDQRARQSTADDIAAIRRALDANRATPGTRRDYLHWLCERNLYLDARGTFQTQRQVQLKLDDIYISLRALPETTPGKLDRDLQDKLDALEARLAGGALAAAELEDQREHIIALAQAKMSGKATLSQTSPLDLAELVGHTDKLVVLGDPGSGKTTLLRFLALKHAEALLFNHSEMDANLSPPRFPIFIRIADYAETGAWRTRSLSDFLAENYTRLECPHAGLDDMLTTALAAGDCIILLDGLDEIVSADERRGVVAQIENFVRRHDDQNNRFVISSRIAGYRSAPLGEPFTHIIIQDMEEADIQRFLNAWCRAVEDAGTPDLSPETRAATAQREIDAILRAVQTIPGVRRLATNPLLLRTLALIHRTGAQLPQKRVELYKLAADTLGRTWRIAQGVHESALVKEEYLTPLLGRLAYWMHINKPTGIATEREVHAVLGEAWADIKDLDWEPDEPNPDIQSEVRSFLLTVREHTGLFVERAPQRYGFMHLTFEEYYAARHLVARSRARASLIRQHLHDPRWEEPILLALGYVGLDSPDDSNELIELAILAQGDQAGTAPFIPSPHEPLLGRDYLFALRCLADQIPVRTRLLRRLVDRFASEYLRRSGSARFERYRAMLEQRNGQLSGSDAGIYLLSLYAQALADPAEQVRSRAANALQGVAASNPEVQAALMRTLSDPDAQVRVQAALALRKSAGSNLEAQDVLVRALDEPDAQVRIMTIQAMQKADFSNPKVLPALVRALDDPDTQVRIGAIHAMQKADFSNPEVLPSLVRALDHPDLQIQIMASMGLRTADFGNPEMLTALVPALTNPEILVRQIIVQTLRESVGSNPEVLAALIQSLTNSDAQVRIGAVQALRDSAGNSPQVLTALVHTLTDSDARVRVQAALALYAADSANPEALSTLVHALAESDIQVRIQIDRALHDSAESNPEVLAALVHALTDSDAQARIGAAQALRDSAEGNPEVLAALVHALTDSDAQVRLHAALALYAADSSNLEAQATLAHSLADSDAEIRVQAAQVLYRADSSNLEAQATLVHSLNDPEAHVRLRAAQTLRKASANNPDALTALVHALVASDEVVRLIADEALLEQQVSHPRVLSLLPKVLEQAESWTTRRNAAQSLGQFAGDDETTRQILWRGLLDTDNDVRTACAEALAQLARRFPDSVPAIEALLLHAIDDPEFDPTDGIENRSGHDYAFHGLWSLLIGDSQAENGMQQLELPF